ncbi:2Fe-2S iron-sulfur cluster binding domain-containing protein [Bradyrhizobium sp. Arg68]|uniref:xanthine dehydrogenase family Fe-S subunit n=1 Tax=Bradyrhizobium ivorense TaxID=2511166 RepID=UPI0027E2D094|nr:2Fe-2S iron-sulfur cluster-binding protein [Bradyrhizobium ivorense]MCC8935986.1 2Fe-2S iron-sulfur cluster binding domain-containing protein [Bradyrhizobium ivorense]
MTTIDINVNARTVKTSVAPRTHLADFLRDHLDLTGTHLGCEHGVCGACTLLIDDMPARSCITFVAACVGAHITTIEGLDGDEIAAELRAAFTREHALQCGYCTPGMLISARDLVLRLEAADDHAIRVGLSGNLCRCTGYVGIVRAVHSVIEDRRKRGIRPVPGAGREQLGPVGSGNGAASGGPATIRPAAAVEPKEGPSRKVAIPEFAPDRTFEERFTIAAPIGEVFAMFGDIKRVAACLPGVSLTGTPTAEHVEGQIRVKLGPISATFRGAARIERDPDTMSGRIVGTGDDQRSRSSTSGEIRYRLAAIDAGAATRVELSIGYSLRGILAQIARDGLVRNLAARLTADFARNLEQQLSGTTRRETAQPIDRLAFLLHQLWRFAKGIGQRTWHR